MTTRTLTHLNDAEELMGAWAGSQRPEHLVATPHPDYNNPERKHCISVADFPSLEGEGVRAPKSFDGGGARLYTRGDRALEWIGDDGPGPSNVEMIEWKRLHLRGQGIIWRNANFGDLSATVIGAPFGFRALNKNPGGQSEHNRARLRVANCDQGVVLGAGSGNPSHRRWDMDAVITGTDKPFSVDKGCNVYGGDFRLTVSAKAGVSNAQICLDGWIPNCRFNILIENKCDIGIALGNDRKPGWQNEGNGQARMIEAHFVQAVEHTAIFDGPMSDLPPYRFTYGNEHNDNHLRPAWICSDGEVWETVRLAS
jgi:hypothetical protein